MSQETPVRLTGTVFSEIKSEKTLIIQITNNLTAKLKWRSTLPGEIDYIIKGTYTGKIESWKLEYHLVNKLESILTWLSFSYNSKVNENTFTEFVAGSGNEQTEITSIRLPKNSMRYMRGKRKVNTKKGRLLFEKGIKKMLTETPTPLLIYRKALNESDEVASFWHLYNIFQILIGERATIDKYLQSNYKLKLVRSDHKGVMITIFIAIRDYFSHPKGTFGGKKLNLNKELPANMETFFKIARKTILRKLDLEKL